MPHSSVECITPTTNQKELSQEPMKQRNPVHIYIYMPNVSTTLPQIQLIQMLDAEIV